MKNEIEKTEIQDGDEDEYGANLNDLLEKLEGDLMENEMLLQNVLEVAVTEFKKNVNN